MTAHTLQDKVALIAGGAKNLGGLLARQFAEAGAAAVDEFGGVDVAVNTVGRVLRKPIVDTTEDELRRHVRHLRAGEFLVGTCAPAHPGLFHNAP